MSHATTGERGEPAAVPTVNALSIDVEEYFHVSAFADRIHPSSWDQYPSRIESATDKVLELLSERNTRATFFLLGWVAERHPTMVRAIAAAGHEIASHGYRHTRVHQQTPAEFRLDVKRTKDVLEDIAGVPVLGYRAASFSIDERSPWAFDILEDAGYRYSSSCYPIRHDHYGSPDAPRFPSTAGASGTLLEIPISTVRLLGRNLPCGGGGYFRLTPYAMSRWALRQVNGRDARSCVFYFHTWEVDPGQPRISGVRLKSRARHYLNLGRMEARLRRLLLDFRWDRIDAVFLGDEHGGAKATGTWATSA